MSRKKKTPPFLIAVIEQHWRGVERTEELLNQKRLRPETQADWLKAYSEETLINQQLGRSQMLESILMEYGCYNGYNYMSEERKSPTSHRISVGDNHPEYAEWRRFYYVRS